MTQEEREAPGGPDVATSPKGEPEAGSDALEGTRGKGRNARADVPSRTRAKSEGHPGWPKMLAALAQGTPQDIAAGLHGLNPETVTMLAKRDERVADDLYRARSKGAQALRARMGKSDDWKREAWELERFAPKVFHLPNRLQVGGDPDGVPLEAALTVRLELARTAARDDHEGPMPALPAETRPGRR